MSKRWFILFLVAITSVLMVCFVYGSSSAVYPSVLVLTFFVLFLVEVQVTSFEVGVTSGLQKLNKPEWPSPVYFAWLFVNDIDRWVRYTLITAYFTGGFLGSFFGWILLLPSKVSFSASFASWLSGMFLMLSIAGLIATSDYKWLKDIEYKKPPRTRKTFWK